MPEASARWVVGAKARFRDRKAHNWPRGQLGRVSRIPINTNTVIDFSEELTGARFLVKVPNAR